MISKCRKNKKGRNSGIPDNSPPKKLFKGYDHVQKRIAQILLVLVFILVWVLAMAADKPVLKKTDLTKLGSYPQGGIDNFGRTMDRLKKLPRAAR